MSSVPSPIAQSYDVLKTEVTWLHGRWICYCQLFASSPKRIEMLNECASTFFFIIEDVLRDEVLISLSKLTDPAATGKNENLSLGHLQMQLDKHGDQALSARNKLTLKNLHDQCSPFREWRNKHLAHLDLQTAMKTSPTPLPGVSREMIDNALSTLRDYLNAIEQHYDNSECEYQNVVMSDDGDALIETIRDGLRYEELVQEGSISHDDFGKGKWHDA